MREEYGGVAGIWLDFGPGWAPFAQSSLSWSFTKSITVDIID